MEFSGISLAVIEVFFVFLLSYLVKISNFNLHQIHSVPYYWLTFTIMTGLWEVFFITNYKETTQHALNLLNNKTHIWTSPYDSSYLLPSKFSILFYSEYAAYGDRMYMTKNDDWSRVIEGSHLLICGFFALLGLYFKSKVNNNKNVTINNNNGTVNDNNDNITINNNKYNIPNDNEIINEEKDIYYISRYFLTIGISMSGQYMNSVLYMVNYFHQTRDSNNPNYDTQEFPTGKVLYQRPFMYVNILWFTMPVIVLNYLLSYANTYTLIDSKKVENTIPIVPE